MEKIVKYNALVQQKDGCRHNVRVCNFNEDFIGKDLWANVFDDYTAELRKNDKSVKDEDMYYLGFEKVLKIVKAEIVTNFTKIYER